MFRVNLATGFQLEFPRVEGMDLPFLKQACSLRRSARESRQEVNDMTSDPGKER